MKKLLYQIHRWGGILLALFMLVWFASGLVIMYASPSALGRTEQLAHRTPVDPQTGWLSLGEAWQRSESARSNLPAPRPERGEAEDKPDGAKAGQATIAEARLVRQGGVPLWLVDDSQGRKLALSALDGSLHRVDVAEGRRIAREWLALDPDVSQADAAAVRHVDTGPQDSGVRNQANLRPFHRYAVGDSGRELLVSARTGEVVRDTTAFERGLYWTGNWIHLLRFLDNIGLGQYRSDVQAWLGTIAVAACITGLIIGWQRWRPGWGGRETYSQGRVHPYRDVWNTWHFWVGLIGGSFALLWAFSGVINTNPWQLFSPANPARTDLARFQGGPPPATMLEWQPAPLALTGTSSAGTRSAQPPVELAWRHVGEQAVLVGTTSEGERSPVATPGTRHAIGQEQVLASLKAWSPGAQVKSHALQDDYDSYYYPRHHQTTVERPLPVLRVELDDSAGTRLYIDPLDGRVLTQQDRSRRVYRWLYSALHHWDFGWLYQRPVWDAWMLPWVLMGIVLGGTSVVLGTKRLKLEWQTFRKRQQKKRKQAAQVAKTPPKPASQSAAIPPLGDSIQQS